MKKALVVIAVCIFVTGCGYRLKRVPTLAMVPTIPVDSHVLTRNISSDAEIERFDLVVHYAPPDETLRQAGIDENTQYIFRVIGLEGETVSVKSGKVLINGRILHEAYEKVPFEKDWGPYKVPEGEFFMLGDNRPNSADSRFWKPSTIKREDIVGKVVKVF